MNSNIMILAKVFEEKLYSKDYVLSINFPTSEYKESLGFKYCRQGIKRFKTKFVLNSDGKYMNTDSDIVYDTREDSDVYQASQGYITLVPLHVEQTCYKALEALKNE